MEKHQLFKDLKNNILPKSYHISYLKSICDLVLSMVNKSPEKRPTIKTLKKCILNIIEELENPSDLGSCSSLKLKKRERINSEDINKIKPFEFKMIFINAEEPKSAYNEDQLLIRYLKVINDKLLIFNARDSSKASLVYNLSESEFTSTNFDNRVEIEIEHPYLNNIKLIKEINQDVNEFLELIRRAVC